MPAKKKDTIKAEEKIISTPSIPLSKEEYTKKSIESGPNVMFMIPLSKGERVGTLQSVIINGVRWNYPKGKMIEVPIKIATLLSERYNVEMNPAPNLRIDRSTEVRKALA